MPAAAVIPAPIAYIKVVAVKKFVVECRQFCLLARHNAILVLCYERLAFTVNKIKCSEQVFA